MGISRAARIVTVHDLTAWRYPELVDRSSAAYPELVAKAVAGGAWVHAPSRFRVDDALVGGRQAQTWVAHEQESSVRLRWPS